MKDGDRELVTAIEVAADGTVLPPMLIYKSISILMRKMQTQSLPVL